MTIKGLAKPLRFEYYSLKIIEQWSLCAPHRNNKAGVNWTENALQEPLLRRRRMFFSPRRMCPLLREDLCCCTHVTHFFDPWCFMLLSCNAIVTENEEGGWRCSTGETSQSNPLTSVSVPARPQGLMEAINLWRLNSCQPSGRTNYSPVTQGTRMMQVQQDMNSSGRKTEGFRLQIMAW